MKLHVPRDPLPGVNLVGPLDTGPGLGEAARMLARTVEHAGIPFVVIPYSDSPRGRPEASDWHASDTAPFDTNLLCLQPDQLSSFAAAARPFSRTGRPSVSGSGNRPSFPMRICRTLRLLDRVWVLSEHVRSVLSPVTSAPVRVIPIPVVDRSVEAISRMELGLPTDGFLFLALFDLVSASRKNPHGVIEAYRAAFAPESGAKLVLKSGSSPSGDRWPDARTSRCRRVRLRPRT